MKTFSMSQAGANIAFPFSVNAPFSVKAIQIDNVTTATIIIGTIAQGGDITIVPPYSARAVLVQDIGTIWISSNGSVTFSTDRLGITLYDSEVQPFVSAYALANGPMIIANQTLFQQGIALGEIATPTNPAASTVDLYAKVDGHFYLLPAGGIEHQLLDDSSALNGAKLTTASVLLAALNANIIAAFAPAAKGVTNGDAHDHIGGDGALITALALNLPWINWTPTISQGVGVTISSTQARYLKIGKFASLFLYTVTQSTGTPTNPIFISGIPAAIAPAIYGNYVSAGTFIAVVGNVQYTGSVEAINPTQLILRCPQTDALGYFPAATLVAGNVISAMVSWECA